MEVILEPGVYLSSNIPQGHFALAYVFAGKGYFDTSTLVDAVQMVVFGNGD